MTSASPPRNPLRTERLTLRPSAAGDAARAFEIQADAAVTRMLRMAAFPPDRQEIRAWFADHEREWLDGRAYRFAVLLDDRMIGLTDLDGIDQDSGELGYWLEQGAWGRGYASEAARAVVRFAFEDLGLAMLRSGHAADNAASGRVLGELGFVLRDTVEVPSRSRGTTILQRRYELPATARPTASDGTAAS